MKGADTALAELGAALSGIEPAQVDTACARIAAAGRIVVYGCGREGLMMRGLAMRLAHLGLDAHVQGEMATPPVGSGDLFFASAGPGELSTVTALMRVAREADAEVLLLTAEPATPSAALADAVLAIPAQTMARDTGAGASAVLPMGSVFEGAMFLLFELMVNDLRTRLGETPETMRARHTNLE
ncbi:SIS domain-containing protein [Psychromarinibacter sp. S121]|uniref:SIS domain-containing protein n=1 Tax=Psychromarinibacter sp. S121 TaxID=3415127 RepID=UPI003C7C7EC7